MKKRRNEKGSLNNAEEKYRQGRKAVKRGKTLEALSFFEKALHIEPENPKFQSSVGLCIAYERGKIKEAISLCEKAIQTDPQIVENYYNLGKVYIKAKLKIKAIEEYRKGLAIDNKNPEIIEELQSLGIRKKPVIPSLPRKNFLNKYLGLILSTLGLR
jgi:tetratricopeptide (TPR) repeat protein